MPNKNNSRRLFGGNEVVANESFYEWYAKATYTINDQWSVGGQEYYSPNVAGTGAWGWLLDRQPDLHRAELVVPRQQRPRRLYFRRHRLLGSRHAATFSMARGVAAVVAVGHIYEWRDIHELYWNWDAGFGWTYKAFTLDLRYYDTNLTKAECNAFTSASNSSFSASNVTPQNPNGLGSNWCSAAYIAKLSFADQSLAALSKVG